MIGFFFFFCKRDVILPGLPPQMSVKFQYIVNDNYSIHEWKMFVRFVHIMAMQLLIRTILLDLFFY